MEKQQEFKCLKMKFIKYFQILFEFDTYKLELNKDLFHPKNYPMY